MSTFDFLLAEIVPFSGDTVSVTSRLSVNGKVFIAPREHIDSLVRTHKF